MSEIKDFMVNLVETVGYPGIFFAMVLESCLVPLPSEITMPAAGALAATGEMNVHIAAWVGALGNVVGSLMAYGLGVKIPEKKITSFLGKYGKFILVSEHEYHRTKKWIHKYGSSVSFFSRLLPGVRTVVSLPAGVARIPLRPFIVMTFLGALLWCYVLVYAGYVLGENWEVIEVYFSKFQYIVIVVFLILFGLYVYKHLKSKPSAKKE
jgi:membrane protein DedA with SNARE-associated domain